MWAFVSRGWPGLVLAGRLFHLSCGVLGDDDCLGLRSLPLFAAESPNLMYRH